MRPGEAWDAVAADHLIARNKTTLMHLERALAARGLELPTESSEAEDPPIGPRWRGLAELLRLHAYWKLARGHETGALEDALKIVRLGHHIENAKGTTLVPMMIAVAIKSIGLESVRAITSQVELPASRARPSIQALEKLRPNPEAWTRMWGGEYRSMRDLLDSELASAQAVSTQTPVWLRPLVPDAYLYQRKRTMGEFAELYRRLQHESTQVCADLGPATEGTPTTVLQRLKLLVSPNVVGNLLFTIATPDFQRIHLRRCLLNSQISATQALLALKAYRDEYGSLPDSLAELSPTYLDGIPQDGYDGQALRYSPEQRTLYTVAKDLQGNGVADSERSWQEATFSITF